MAIINQIHHGEVPGVLSCVPDGLVDLIVTSPPYNVDLGNNKYNKTPYSLYKDNREHKDYLVWLKGVFEECYRCLKSGGRIAINVGDGKNGAVPTHSDIIQMMVNDLGYICMATIIWNKNHVSNRTSWGTFCSPKALSFPKPFEYIMVFAKENRALQCTGESDLTREEFIDWSLALWNFKPEHRLKAFGHPAMFPEELPARCIKMLSWKDAVVMDPFSGAGTTCKVAQDLGRSYIGFEMDEKYVEISRKRLEEGKGLF